ncbi:MAG: tRNA pseudouridine(55) synthase TruB [Bacteroidia bacterium]|nr:tRNA pseudouridine(55) synthase TruB [Bacteroidia bacterium]
MEGIILVDKPYGWSSFKVVSWVKEYFGFQKAGHAGTLDPLATGLVLVAVDKATREIASFQGLPKEYYALVVLGWRSPSDDAEFMPERVAEPAILSEDERKALLVRFVGDIQQRPPAFSALKVRGKRAYALARRGKAVSLPPRLVSIYSMEEVAYNPPYRWLLRIHCGKGVYIRSLARDIGEATGWGGYLGALRRTRIGPYTVYQALQPDGCLPR